MKRISLLTLAAVLCAALAAQTSTRRGLKPEAKAAVQASVAAVDTIAAPEAHLVDINGYDKPLRSRRETFFVTNNSRRDICGLAFTITYYDTARRVLHSASHNVKADIPAGQTRQQSVRSWDTQFSFYYRRSATSQRAAQATPYDVAVKVDTLFVIR
ncbi:MAG: hypothetical protein K2F78_05760 [Muribaculaceae bacterium]|nr:hypothetical protein [Muribaculaceae bacterium]